MANGKSFRVLKIHPDAQLPLRAKSDDAGYDIFAIEDAVVPHGGQLMVPTGLKMAFPKGTYGRIAPRSGLALKQHIHIMAGVVDRGYRGEVKIIVRNMSGYDAWHISKGDAIAQMILERIETPPVQEVQSLDETDRAEGGFGSTDPLTRHDNESADT
jgi:dUTP pyrophosphatase